MVARAAAASSRHDGLAGDSGQVAAGGTAAWLRPRPQPDRDGLGNIKTVELASLCPDTPDEARDAAEAGLKRVSSNSQLCFAFLAHTGLSL
jgi:hypothetical protein